MPKEKPLLYKVTYESPTTAKRCKKDFVTITALKAFVKEKALKKFSVWNLDKKASKAS